MGFQRQRLHRATRRLARNAIACAAALIVLAVPHTAAPQPYPARPLRLVLGFPPGGTSDILARALGEQLAAGLGQPVVIDNRPGAAGNIAAELAAKAPADGYTLLLSSGSSTVAPSLYPKLGYDFVRDFTQVTMVADVPFMLAVHPQLPARTLADLIAHVRARPREVNYASSGVGTPSHLAGELLTQRAGLELTHVPYKGTVAALVDLVSGRVQFYFTSFPGALAHVRANRIRAIAVTSERRSATLPEAPTMSESGLAGYRAGSWYGLAMPSGVAPAIVDRIHAIVQKSLDAGELKAKLSEQGLDVIQGITPRQAADFVRQDIARWADVVRRAGVKLN
ncbi:MAG: tripartite tricarboxylate transporter substrate binding protein [Burkholderiales bacterium]|nr:tripartite tricarboxylate transporter substrate binding protein [Burkholderiales bacterium]